MPAARSSGASRRWATPSRSAPAARAARATGTIPWTYPSAFTTAISCAPGACSRRTATFAATASRSTTAPASRPGGSCVRSAARAATASGEVRVIRSLSVSGATGQQRPDDTREGARDVARQDRPARPAVALVAAPAAPAGSPGPAALAGQGGSPAVDVGRERRGVGGSEPGGEQRAEDAGEHVPRARGGEPRRCPGHAAHRSPRRDDDRRRALDEHGRPGRGDDLARGGERARLDLRALHLAPAAPHRRQEPGELTGVRGEDGELAERVAQGGILGEER